MAVFDVLEKINDAIDNGAHAIGFSFDLSKYLTPLILKFCLASCISVV